MYCSCVLQLPALQDDEPPSDYYGKFSNRDRGFRGGSKERRGFKTSQGWGRGSGDDNDASDFRRGGGRGNRSDSSWSRSSRDSSNDWLIGGRRSGRSTSSGSRDR